MITYAATTLYNGVKQGEMTDFITRLIIFTLIHSLLALPRLQRGIGEVFPRIKRFYRLLYNGIAVVTFFWAMGTWHLAPVLYIVPGAGSLIFYLMQLICLGLIARCTAQTGMGDFLGFGQLRGIPRQYRLVTTGCYGRVRHPLYTLSFIFLALNPVMTLKWLILTIYSSIYFVAGAKIEERRLTAEFGEAYRHYQERVPMFLPKMRK